ncbi:MAG: DUF559 domain-containing protein, partial [Candidatus Methylomirabilis sp.]|nr:DUF559 domain-containing protein [Deltaproteobacteria bacterium]
MDRHDLARQLRKDMTDAERRLWTFLRRRELGVRFRRQEPIGPYIVDFACIKRRLIVEVDGGHHAENAAADAARTPDLERRGYRVIRFWNSDVVTNMDAVVREIEAALAEREIAAHERGPL